MIPIARQCCANLEIDSTQIASLAARFDGTLLSHKLR
jgi:hypothetical protein